MSYISILYPMYDTIKLTLSEEHCPGTDFLQTVPQYLTNVKHPGYNEFGKLIYVTGFLDNLNVTISENGVSINKGSLCKYLLGNNFSTLSRDDTKRAIEKISDSLYLPFHLANITRIDFAQNLIMKYYEKVYYPYLGVISRYSRLEQDNGLYYNTKKKQLVFYGKKYEQKQKNEPIPDFYKSLNILRYEMRLKSDLRHEFNRSEITASLLYDEKFCNDIINKWENGYLSIKKNKSDLNYMKPTGSKIKFVEYLALYAITSFGQPNVLNNIKELLETGSITKKQAYDLRVSVLKICELQTAEKSNDFINELTEKVKGAAQNWRYLC